MLESAAGHPVPTQFAWTGPDEDEGNAVSFLFNYMNLVGRVRLNLETLPFLLLGLKRPFFHEIVVMADGS